MRRNEYICFGGRAYDATIELIVRDAPKFGADQVKVYDDRFILDHEFYRLNEHWWHHPDAIYGHERGRGFGWFIWKPFVILHALEQLAGGDVLLYTDADTYPIADLRPLYQRCVDDGGIMFFAANGCNHAHWCKRDAFLVMGQDDAKRGHVPCGFHRFVTDESGQRYLEYVPQSVATWRHRQHAVARFMLFQAGRWKCRQLLMEWLTYCLNPLANSFDPSVLLPEYPELHEPRCEQAILTNLVNRYGYKLYREACQAGADQPEDQDLYPQTFVQVDNATDRSDVSGSRFRNVLP